MSLDPIKHHINTEIVNAIKNEPQGSRWGHQVVKIDHKGKQLNKLLKAIVNHAPWKSKTGIYWDAIQDIVPRLETKTAKMSTKIKKSFENLKKTITTAHKADIVYTAKIEKTENCKELRKDFKKWEKKSDKLYNNADKAHEDLAENSARICELLRQDTPKKIKKNKHIPVIAYTEKGEIAGGMLYDNKKKKVKISLIAKNPTQLPGIGKNTPVKGAGTALIADLVKDMTAKGKKKDIHLDSLPTAIGFYEKLGFKKTGKEDDGLTPMVLKKKSMDEFLKKSATINMVHHKEPKVKNLDAAV